MRHMLGETNETVMAMQRRNDPDDDDAVPTEVARQIDENLKRLYGTSGSDDLPPELQQLIASLRAGDPTPDTGAESA